MGDAKAACERCGKRFEPDSEDGYDDDRLEKTVVYEDGGRRCETPIVLCRACFMGAPDDVR